MKVFFRVFGVFIFVIFLGIAGKGLSWSKEAPTDMATWFVDQTQFGVSAHAQINCSECHGDMKKDGKAHPDLNEVGFLNKEIIRTFDYSTCKKCHPQAYRRYLLGEHAKALQKERDTLAVGKELEEGKLLAPTCGSCHSSHYVKAKLSRVETGAIMTETCGECHLEEKLSYLENFHGKTAVFHKNEDSAFCSDCHGAHECRSLKETKASLAACRRCHPQANEQFAGFIIHASTKNLTKEDQEKIKKVNLIHTVEIIGLAFVLLVLGFFYFHTLVWFVRKMHEKLRKR